MGLTFSQMIGLAFALFVIVVICLTMIPANRFGGFFFRNRRVFYFLIVVAALGFLAFQTSQTAVPAA